MSTSRTLALFFAALAMASFASANIVADGPFYIRYDQDSSDEDRTRVLSIVIGAIKLTPDGAVYLCSTASPGKQGADLVAMTRKSLRNAGIMRERIYVGGACAEAVTAMPTTDTPKDAVFVAIGSREWLKSIHRKQR
jgi:hypothetical protein